MSTLPEIEAMIPTLNAEELAALGQFVRSERRKAAQTTRHSVLDIPAVNVGRILKPLSSDDDLLGEMLEGRM